MIPLTPSNLHRFSPTAFRDLAMGALANPPPDEPYGPSDFDLTPELAAARPFPDALAKARPAAVLIPAIARETVSLLLTQRTAHLTAHAGQIAFPGGKTEPSDTGPLDTALREAREEIGLDPSLVVPLGILDRYLTGTGFWITPVIGLVDPDFKLTLDSNEVADAFEVPLPFLMDPMNYQRHTLMIDGLEQHFHAVPFGDRFIWGATAGILRNMHQRLFAS